MKLRIMTPSKNNRQTVSGILILRQTTGASMVAAKRIIEKAPGVAVEIPANRFVECQRGLTDAGFGVYPRLEE